MKTLALMAVAVFAGTALSDRFLVKWTPDDDGFLPAGEGIGLDNAAHAVASVAIYKLLRTFIKS